MSSLPGYTLEAFISWNFDLVIEDLGETNVSLGMAELLGNIAPRKTMSKEKFTELITTFFEPYRESVELYLGWFDGDSQSWRDYSACVFDCIPEPILDNALAWIRLFFEKETKGNQNGN